MAAGKVCNINQASNESLDEMFHSIGAQTKDIASAVCVMIDHDGVLQVSFAGKPFGMEAIGWLEYAKVGIMELLTEDE